MRDLTRPNAKKPAFRKLTDAGFKVFTPLSSKIITSGGKRTIVQTPVIHDLLFVFAEKEALDRMVETYNTLQYRYVKGAPYRTPMKVRATDMDKFVAAVSSVNTPRYFSPEEITSGMYGAKVRIISEGPINGFEGKLLKIKGSGKKRFLVELPGVLVAAIEVKSTDYVELLESK